MSLTIDQLIQVLQEAKHEIGGNTVIKLYSGSEFYSIPYDDCEWLNITGIEVKETKLYYGTHKPSGDTKNLFFKFE